MVGNSLLFQSAFCHLASILGTCAPVRQRGCMAEQVKQNQSSEQDFPAHDENLGLVSLVQQLFPPRVLDLLLLDRTTGENIVWADDEYEPLGEGYLGKNHITVERITGENAGLIKTRVEKELARQSLRTKTRAEVFTPSWLCNQMNNHLDAEWFGRAEVFNVECEQRWEPIEDNITFPDDPRKTWRDYVNLRKLEITCGEAPFICARYDTVAGDPIPVNSRIGFLDRKLRAVSENAADYDEWLKWAYRALEATYGYEYQGDNLVVARINVLLTFAEHLNDAWSKQPTSNEIKHAANIVSWNIWQMDGLTGTVPSDKPAADESQISIFEMGADEESRPAPFCRIYDWRSRRPQTYVVMKSEVNAL